MEHAQRALRKAETELHNLHEKHDDEVHKWDARHDHLQRRFDSLRKRKNELLMESDVSYHFADTLMQAAALAWADTVAPDAYDSDAHRDAFDEKYEELMVLREATYKRIKAQYKDPVTDD